MRTLNLKQGSEEWLAARRKYFTASEAGAMMGDSLYMSRAELLDKKVSGIDADVNSFQEGAFERGHEAEQKARPVAEKIIDEELYPITVVDDDDRLLASLDGATMDGEIIWEHKLYNDTLAEQIKTENISPHYIWQLEHQLLVSGAKKVLFMASDGTKEKMEAVWYQSDPEKRKRLIAGWDQFEEDLKTHTVSKKEPKLAAEEIQSLPSLFVRVKGEVSATNIADYTQIAKKRIFEIKTDLVSDQDFVDAESMVKFLDNGEKELERVKKAALAETADIEQVFNAIDDLKAEMRSKRLNLNKQVTNQKTARKREITQEAIDAINAHIKQLNEECNGYLVTPQYDLESAMKGKRTLETLRAAADSVVTKIKVDASLMADRIKENIPLFKEADEQGVGFLFRDINDLVTRETDAVKAIIHSRCDDYKKELEKRKAKPQEPERSLKDEMEPPVYTEKYGKPNPVEQPDFIEPKPGDGYDYWWYVKGSGLGPEGAEDMEEHAHRVCRICWEDCEKKIRGNYENSITRKTV